VNKYWYISDLLAVIGPLFCQGWRFRLWNEMYAVERRRRGRENKTLEEERYP